MEKYYRIRLYKVLSNLEEEVTLLCFKHNSQGISEALNYVQKNLEYDPQVRSQKYKDIDVFFNEKPVQLFFDELKQLDWQIRYETFEEEHKDWLSEWKKGFKPFPLVGPYWVVPSWEKAPKEAVTPLWIDPGMAFGTGTHATTQLAAALIHRIYQAPQKYKPADVIDVGTGTAILAMIAKYSGANDVIAIDIDPEATRVARENIKANSNISNVIVSDLLLEDIKSQFDLVIANIIDGVLLKLKDDLIRAMKPKSHIIVTGILEERENLFIDEFLKNTNLKIERRLAKEEWVGFWLTNF